jgi:hypothetical protein
VVTHAPKNRLTYMSPQWQDALRTAARLADACDLEMFIGAEPGFAGIGGPWVTPAQAMKKFVWSRTLVQGGRPFKGRLASPPSTTGPFQNSPHIHLPFDGTSGEAPLQFYADAAVVAYPLPADGVTAPAHVTVTSSDGAIDATLLNDGDLEKSISLSSDRGRAWVQFTYDRLQTFRSAVLGTPYPVSGPAVNLGTPLQGRLEAQDGGGVFRVIASMTAANVPQVTVSFPPITAKVFRVMFSQTGLIIPPFIPPPGIDASSLLPKLVPPVPKEIALSELSLQAEGRVNEFERKAGFAIAEDYYAVATPKDAANAPVSTSDVVDLTMKMTSDGVLDWTPPSGQWVVLRLGYSLTGTLNHPSPREAAGLEADKLNRGFVQDYLKTYLGMYTNILTPSLMGAHGLRGLFMDSIESGPQNWTDDMLAQFQRLRGYDAHPWLPALTGVVVQSAEASDKFLWDFRRSIAQLLAQNLYSEIATAAHAHGLRQYGEALEMGRLQLGDDMEMRRYTDVPVGAMWTYAPEKGPYPSHVADQRGAASVAHLYGQNVTMAESFTNIYDEWAFSPRDLKPIADLEFTLGINRLLSIGVDRRSTWAKDTDLWMSYLARSSYLLQQGKFIADVAYFYGEESPLTVLADLDRLQDVPKYYAFDFVNADAILNLFDVRDGYILTPSGMRYRVLQLGGSSSRMTLPVLHKLKDLVSKGAIIVGRRPIESPSLSDDDAEFRALVDSLWGEGAGAHAFYKGRVFAEGSADAALATLAMPPDLDYAMSGPERPIAFVHRGLSDGDIYFLNNRSERDASVDVTLRVTGRTPELWHPETGQTERVSYIIQNGRTTIPVHLEPWGTEFVVFRQPAISDAVILPIAKESPLATLDGPWQVTFEKDRGAPSSTIFRTLTSWSDNADEGIKYFSGTATYTKILNASTAWFKQGASLIIDLGDARDLAGVTVNGKTLGVLWHQPYRFEATRALHAGANTIQIEVTNLWVNRMIGDARPNANGQYASVVDHPLTFSEEKATHHAYLPDAPLRPAGLLGAVVLVQSTTQSAPRTLPP